MKRLRGMVLSAPAIVIATILFGTVSLIAALFDKTGAIPIAIARAWARFLLAVSGVKVRVEGLENIKPGSSYVFTSNHLSYMDTPVALSYIPVQFRFLAKHGLFQIPFLGTHLRQAGHIPVPREDPRGAVKTMQQAAEAIAQKGISLLIFPEGGRSQDGVLRPFKEGAAYIAIRAGAPLVPLVLIGTREVLAFGAGVVLPGRVTLRIMPPIETTNLSLKDRGRITDEIREITVKALNDTARES